MAILSAAPAQQTQTVPPTTQNIQNQRRRRGKHGPRGQGSAGTQGQPIVNRRACACGKCNGDSVYLHEPRQGVNCVHYAIAKIVSPVHDPKIEHDRLAKVYAEEVAGDGNAGRIVRAQRMWGSYELDTCEPGEEAFDDEEKKIWLPRQWHLPFQVLVRGENVRRTPGFQTLMIVLWQYTCLRQPSSLTTGYVPIGRLGS